jgi:hypothetical protein
MIIDFLKKNYLNIIIIIILVIILFIISSTLFLYSSYKIYNVVKKYINNRQLICKYNNYTDKDKKILEIYGNYKIRKIYIVYTSFTNITRYGLNILLYLGCGKTLDQGITELKKIDKNFEQSHAGLIFELKIKKKQSKFIYLQKELTIDMDTDFFINNKSNIIPIKLKNKTITIKNLLDITEKRIGKEKFFNWHGCAYNCHTFIDDILLTLELSEYGKNKFQHTQKQHEFILNNLYSNNNLAYYLYNFFMNDTVFKIYKFLIYIT